MVREKFDLMETMTDALNDFYSKHDLDHECALDSLMGGNFKTPEQRQWLEHFCKTWEALEDTLLSHSKTTQTLYENSAFHDWLLTMPENVKSSFCDNDVDLYGQRVVITFITEEGEEES